MVINRQDNALSQEAVHLIHLQIFLQHFANLIVQLVISLGITKHKSVKQLVVVMVSNKTTPKDA